MLQEAIDDYRSHRIAERGYLHRIMEIAEHVGSRDRGRKLPAVLGHDDDAAAVYGALDEVLADAQPDGLEPHALAQIVLSVLAIVRQHLIVGVWSNQVAQNAMLNALDDYLWAEVEGVLDIELSPELADEVEQRVLSVSRARFPM